MSGRNQHIIPRHFQKPFSIPGSKEQIWLYRNGLGEPKSVSISRAAAQRDFYSKPSSDGSSSLDDLITDYEGGLSDIVQQLREFEVGDELPAAQVAEVVTHLSVRSSYMRGVVEDGAASMAATISEIANGFLGGEQISLPKHRVPTGLGEFVLKEINARGLMAFTNVSEKTVSKIIYFALREEGPGVLAIAKSTIAGLLEELSFSSKQLGKSAQTSVLSDHLAPIKRRQHLEALDWRVHEASPEGAVLPDCTSIAFDGVKWSSHLVNGGNDAEIVVLPLTPNKLAVGQRDRQISFDEKKFNEHAVAASHTFFLSAVRHSEFEGAISNLGGQVRRQLGELTSSAASQTVNEFLAIDPLPSDLGEDGSAHSWVIEGDLPSEVTVTLFDFGEEDFGKRVSEALSATMTSFANLIPPVGIAQFVFANDYEAALQSVDRGFEPSTPTSITDEEDRVGVAMPLTVIREEKLKTVAVLRSGVAAWLVSDDPSENEDAAQIVASLLASASLTNLIRNKFPSQMLKAAADPYESFLLGSTQGVFSAYFCTSYSVWADASLNLHKKMSEDSLLAAVKRIPELKSEYMAHQDMERLWPECSMLCCNIMFTAARYFGCLKCRGEKVEGYDDIVTVFGEHGLGKWVNLFQADLHDFDAQLEQWAEFEQIFFLNRHLERLAFQFGLLPESNDDAPAYIHVNF